MRDLIAPHGDLPRGKNPEQMAKPIHVSAPGWKLTPQLWKPIAAAFEDTFAKVVP